MNVDRLIFEGQVAVAMAFALPWVLTGIIWLGLRAVRRWRHHG